MVGTETAGGGVHPLPRVGVIGSGSDDPGGRAERLGAALAGLDVHLITGGGGGAMAGAARGFTRVRPRRGLSVGILPGDPPPGYPNPWIELPVATHLPARGPRGMDPDSRNHLVVLTATVVVAVPGHLGTLSEVRLALRYGRPLVAHLDRRDQIPGMPEAVPLASSRDEVLAFVEGHLTTRESDENG